MFRGQSLFVSKQTPSTHYRMYTCQVDCLLPETYQGYQWKLVYRWDRNTRVYLSISSSFDGPSRQSKGKQFPTIIGNSITKHGASFNTFYRYSRGKTPTLLAVKTNDNEVSTRPSYPCRCSCVMTQMCHCCHRYSEPSLPQNGKCQKVSTLVVVVVW